jgi:hypothetical protein
VAKEAHHTWISRRARSGVASGDDRSVVDFISRSLAIVIGSC